MSNFPTDDDQTAVLFGDKQDELASSCYVSMGQILKALEATWGHRCHAVIVAIPMTTDMRPVGMIAMDSFGGSPDAIMEVAQYLTMSVQEGVERHQTGGVH